LNIVWYRLQKISNLGISEPISIYIENMLRELDTDSEKYLLANVNTTIVFLLHGNKSRYYYLLAKVHITMVKQNKNTLNWSATSKFNCWRMQGHLIPNNTRSSMVNIIVVFSPSNHLLNVHHLEFAVQTKHANSAPCAVSIDSFVSTPFLHNRNHSKITGN